MKLKYFMLGMYLSAILCGVIFYRAVKQMPKPETKIVYVSEKDKMMIKLERRFVLATKAQRHENLNADSADFTDNR